MTLDEQQARIANILLFAIEMTQDDKQTASIERYKLFLEACNICPETFTRTDAQHQLEEDAEHYYHRSNLDKIAAEVRADDLRKETENLLLAKQQTITRAYGSVKDTTP